MSKLVDRLARVVFFVLFGGIVVGGIVTALPRWERMKSLAKEKERVQRLVEEKKAEIAELKEQQRRYSNDRGFVEKLARRNRRVYPGELVFIFDD